MYDPLLSAVLGRNASLFSEDFNLNENSCRERLKDARVLVIGAAGSIGSAFAAQIARFNQKCLHLVDTSENNLVELVRNLRSSRLQLPDDFQALPISLGSREFDAFMDAHKPYDYIVNFSAMKHVRSEKDPYSLMRMYDTNVRFVNDLLLKLSGTDLRKFFSVSSDKAVNPANVMGATKIFMERVHLLHADAVPFSTARFANVAFSDGSLLHGFHQRIIKKQPISAPSDVKRYFISHEEAGQLCLLSCLLGENRDIYFPKLDENLDLKTFSDIACIFLQEQGLEPELHDSEEDAKAAAEGMSPGSKRWPCYFFASDTTGEKPFEEFYAPSDPVDFTLYAKVGVIHQPGTIRHDDITAAMASMEKIRKGSLWSKAEMVKSIQSAVPELVHEERNRNLDQKM